MEPIDLKWVQIDRKTDFLAFTLFLFSIFAFGPKLYNTYIKTSDIIIYPPENVLIIPYKLTGSSEDIVRIAVTLTYENIGHSKHSDTIKKEYAVMEIIGDKESKSYRFVWDYEIFPVPAKTVGNVFDMKYKKLSIPFKINGSDIYTHMTYFTPDQTTPENELRWETFKSEMGDQEKFKKIKFTFGFETFKGDGKETVCILKISKFDINHVKSENNLWMYPLVEPI